jgi:hypothetical protein
VWLTHNNEVVARVASFEPATVGTIIEADHHGGAETSLESAANMFLVLSSVIM